MNMLLLYLLLLCDFVMTTDVRTLRTDQLFVQNTAYRAYNAMYCGNVLGTGATSFAFFNVDDPAQRVSGSSQQSALMTMTSFPNAPGVVSMNDVNNNPFVVMQQSTANTAALFTVYDTHTPNANEKVLFEVQSGIGPNSAQRNGRVLIGGRGSNADFLVNVYGSWCFYDSTMNYSLYYGGGVGDQIVCSKTLQVPAVTTASINSFPNQPLTLTAGTVLISNDLQVTGTISAGTIVAEPVTTENFYQDSAGVDGVTPSTKDAGYLSVYNDGAGVLRSAGLFYRCWDTPEPTFRLFYNMPGSLRGSSTINTSSPDYLPGNLVMGELSAVSGVFSNDVVVNGVLRVAQIIEAQSVITLKAQNTEIDDPTLKLANGNLSNLYDTGVYAQYKTDVTRYNGYFFKAGTNQMHLFTNTTVEPGTTVNVNAPGYQRAGLVAGAIEASGAITSSGTITAADGLGDSVVLNPAGYATVTKQPTAADQLTRKDYVDNAISGLSGFHPFGQWYVAPNGSNASGTGSPNKPWQTISYAISQIEPLLAPPVDAIINVAAGVYNENISISRRISLYGVPGTTPTVSTAQPVQINGRITYVPIGYDIASTLSWLTVGNKISRGGAGVGQVYLSVTQCRVSVNVNDDVIAMSDGTLVLEQSIVQNAAVVTSSANLVTRRGRFALVSDTSGQLDASYPISGGAVGADATILAAVFQSDDKLLLGGQFTTMFGQGRPSLARLNADGTLDASFVPNITLGLETSALFALPGGEVLVGLQGFGIPTPNFLVKLTNSGSIDATFNPGGAGPDAAVLALAQQSDGKFIVGGQFGTYNGVAYECLVRINADGTLDNTFTNVRANGPIRSIAIDSTGRIVVGGQFTSIGNVGGYTYLARLNSDGTLDSSFNPYFNNQINAVAIQSDGAIICAGRFTVVGTTQQMYITRLTTTGSLDTTFTPPTFSSNGFIRSILLQSSSGKIVCGGEFTVVGGTYKGRCVRLNTNGSLDTTFLVNSGGFNSAINAIVERPSDSQLLLAGGFTICGGKYSPGLATLTSATGLISPAQAVNDIRTSQSVPGNVFAIAYSPLNNKYIIGGQFASINGEAYSLLARLNADLTLDTTFANPNISGLTNQVLGLAIQSDGKIIAVGSFNTVGGVAQQGVCRLHADGTRDTTWTENLNFGGAFINDVVIQDDGGVEKAIIVGAFSAINGQSTGRIARLMPNGAIDATFNASQSGANATIQTIVASGISYFIAGSFKTYNGTNVTNLVKIDGSGALDNTFTCDLGAVSVINSVYVQADGNVLFGGSLMSSVNGSVLNSTIARVDATGQLDVSFAVSALAEVASVRQLANTSIIVCLNNSSTFAGAVRNFVVRLSASGVVDNTFQGGLNSIVQNSFKMVEAPNGDVLVAGYFTGASASASINRLLNVPGSLVTVRNSRLAGSYPNLVYVTKPSTLENTRIEHTFGSDVSGAGALYYEPTAPGDVLKLNRCAISSSTSAVVIDADVPGSSVELNGNYVDANKAFTTYKAVWNKGTQTSTTKLQSPNTSSINTAALVDPTNMDIRNVGSLLGAQIVTGAGLDTGNYLAVRLNGLAYRIKLFAQ